MGHASRNTKLRDDSKLLTNDVIDCATYDQLFIDYFDIRRDCAITKPEGLYKYFCNDFKFSVCVFHYEV